MFQFLMMGDTYESRKVGRWDSKDGKRMVSTCEVNDGAQPYETAFMHPDYNDGSMVIVEAYGTKKKAEAGHKKWLKIMQEGPLPDVLKDCANSEIAQFGEALGADRTYKRKAKAS